MDKFSSKIFRELIKQFPSWEQYRNTDEQYLEVDVPAPKVANIGGLVIQITKDKDIWIRNYHPCSGYCVNDIKELTTIIKGVLSDCIFWVIGFKNDEWVETTLVNKTDDIETEKGVTYKVLSWSGTFDKVFTAD